MGFPPAHSAVLKGIARFPAMTFSVKIAFSRSARVPFHRPPIFLVGRAHSAFRLNKDR